MTDLMRPKNKQCTASWLLAALLATVLTACGGGGSSSGSGGNGDGGGSADASYKGSTDPAVVTEENKGDAANAAKEGSLAAIKTEKSPDLPVAASASAVPSATLLDARQKRVSQIARPHVASEHSNAETVMTARVGFTLPGECGGSVSSRMVNEELTVFTYDDFCVEGDAGGSETISGTVRMESDSEDASYSRLTYQDFVVNDGGGALRIPNWTLECRSGTCEIFSDFVGTDGVIYRVMSSNVETDASGNYDVDAQVCSGGLDGCITFEARGLVECPDSDGFSAGTITITDATQSGESVQVRFENGCGSAPSVEILSGTSPD